MHFTSFFSRHEHNSREALLERRSVRSQALRGWVTGPPVRGVWRPTQLLQTVLEQGWRRTAWQRQNQGQSHQVRAEIVIHRCKGFSGNVR